MSNDTPDTVVDSEHYVAVLHEELTRVTRERLLLLALTRQQSAQLTSVSQAYEATAAELQRWRREDRDVNGAAASDSPP